LVVIAVSGPPGSGKTSVAKAIAETFGLRYVSAGSIFRKAAQERGLGIDEFSLLAEGDPSIDRAVDEATREEEDRGDVVLDGHLTAWVIREGIRIYVKAPRDVRYARIAKRDGIPLERAITENSTREESEVRRYKAIYGYDVKDLSAFDLVIDTANLSEGDTKEVVMDFLRRHEKIKRRS